MKGLMVWPCTKEKDRITKRVWVGHGRDGLIPRRSLRKRGLDVRQGRRMVQDRSEWRGFVRGNA